MKTSGNVVFITGGASGIGLALAEAFLARDNAVIVCGRNPDRLGAVRAAHPSIHTQRCDLTDPAQMSALVRKLEAEFGELNILVNNAGVQYQYPAFHEVPDGVRLIGQEIDINLTAAARLTYLLLPMLLRQPQAAVINVSSALALVPRDDVPVYCATKAALHAFSRSLRCQLKATPVKVFEVMPPQVDTAMTAGSDDPHKMSPAALADEVLAALAKDRYEIRAGLARTLAVVNRLSPRVAEYLIHN